MLGTMLEHYRHTYRSSDPVGNWIQCALKSTNEINFVRWHHSEIPAIGELWAIVDSAPSEDYSDLIDISNWHCITEDMRQRFPRQTDFEREYFAIQVLTKRGKPTKAAEAFYDILARLDGYSLYNDDDHSRRESELTSEGNDQSIKEFSRIGRVGEYPNRFSVAVIPDLPDDYVSIVWKWIYDNDPEALERAELGYHGNKDAAGWINGVSLLCAFYALNYIDFEYHDDSDRETIESYMEEYIMHGWHGINNAFKSWRVKITD